MHARIDACRGFPYADLWVCRDLGSFPAMTDPADVFDCWTKVNNMLGGDPVEETIMLQRCKSQDMTVDQLYTEAIDVSGN
jgi:hypothetical protein